jgi:hypothetical protein
MVRTVSSNLVDSYYFVNIAPILALDHVVDLKFDDRPAAGGAQPRVFFRSQRENEKITAITGSSRLTMTNGYDLFH